MSNKAVRELQSQLDAEAHEVDFLDYVSSPAVEQLQAAVAKTINTEAETLTKAIKTGTAALPAPLSWLAGGILG